MAEKVLIIDDDLDTLKLVGLMLERQGYEISAASSGEQGLSKALADKPDIVLLDVMMADLDGLEVTRRLRKSPSTQATPILLFTAKTQVPDKIAGFEAGADDYLTKPTHPAELQAHVRALLDRSGPARAAPSGTDRKPPRGYVIGVLAARGGLGVSTLASNLAGAVRAKTQGEVILAELTPGSGSLGTDLGVPNSQGLNEVLSGAVDAITPEKVDSLLAAHASGLRILAASDQPRDVALVGQASNYDRLVARLAALARFIVLDLGSALPASVEKILPACNAIVVLIEGSQHAIAQAKMLLDDIAALGLDKNTIKVVLNNRVRSEASMTLTEVQQSLGHTIGAVLMPAPEMLAAAARIHSLAVLFEPNNTFSQQIYTIADQVLKRQPSS